MVRNPEKPVSFAFVANIPGFQDWNPSVIPNGFDPTDVTIQFFKKTFKGCSVDKYTVIVMKIIKEFPRLISALLFRIKLWDLAHVDM